MALKVLGISSSPRADGNSDLLLRQALEAAQSAGAQVEYLPLRDMNIGPCQECNACHQTGVCRVEDDYQTVFPQLLEADRLIFATPVFFMGVSAQAKALIDRGQCLWARKYVLNRPLFPGEGRERRAMVIAVGGTSGRQMFRCIRFTMKYWLDTLEMKYVANLFVNQAEEHGAILTHPCAMQQARRLGEELVATRHLPAKIPVNVELF